MTEWKNVSAGPRQVKDFNKSVSALQWEGRNRDELYGVIGGQERRSTVAHMMGPVRAEVATIGGYSAHADRTELRAWVRGIGGRIGRAFVLHGGQEAAEAMAEILREEGVREVQIPRHGQSFEL